MINDDRKKTKLRLTKLENNEVKSKIHSSQLNKTLFNLNTSTRNKNQDLSKKKAKKKSKPVFSYDGNYKVLLSISFLQLIFIQ